MNRDDGVILNEILDTSKPEAQEIALECNLMLNESSDYLPTHPSSFSYSYSSYSSSSAGAIDLSAEHYGGGGMSFLKRLLSNVRFREEYEYSGRSQKTSKKACCRTSSYLSTRAPDFFLLDFNADFSTFLNQLDVEILQQGSPLRFCHMGNSVITEV